MHFYSLSWYLDIKFMILERKRRDLVSLDERVNAFIPEEGVQQLTTGFRKWAERYLGNCAGQRNHAYQINRMNKWNEALQKHLAEHPNRQEGYYHQFGK